MTRRAREPRLEPGELSAEQRDLYDAIAGGPRGQGPQAFPLADDAGRLEGPFNAMLLSPGIGTAVQELGAALRYRGGLGDRAREVAILELATLRRSEFEWYAHERLARRSGLDAQEIEAIRTNGAASRLSDDEAVVRRTVRRFVVDRDIGDAEFAEAEQRLGAAALAELIFLVGYYDMLALSLRVWRTPLPSGVPPTFEPDAPAREA